ncbi:MAG: N-acetyltransferase, partial [Chloroflexota bacterium]
MELIGQVVRLRPVRSADLEPLTRILAELEVARWWPNHDAARVEAEIVGDEPDTTHWAIELDG